MGLLICQKAFFLRRTKLIEFGNRLMHPVSGVRKRGTLGELLEGRGVLGKRIVGAHWPYLG